MRLKRNRMEEFFHRTAVPKKDKEGASYVEYGAPESFMAETWPGGGKAQIEMYGMRLPNIRNCRMEGNYCERAGLNGGVCFTLDGGPSFKAGDGICLYVRADQEPDYKIVAVYPYHFLTLELERM